MVDSADIYFIQHFADIYFSKFVCISVCGGYQVSRTYCQVSFSQNDLDCLQKLNWFLGQNLHYFNGKFRRRISSKQFFADSIHVNSV